MEQGSKMKMTRLRFSRRLFQLWGRLAYCQIDREGNRAARRLQNLFFKI